MLRKPLVRSLLTTAADIRELMRDDQRSDYVTEREAPLSMDSELFLLPSHPCTADSASSGIGVRPFPLLRYVCICPLSF